MARFDDDIALAAIDTPPAGESGVEMIPDERWYRMEVSPDHWVIAGDR